MRQAEGGRARPRPARTHPARLSRPKAEGGSGGDRGLRASVDWLPRGQRSKARRPSHRAAWSVSPGPDEARSPPGHGARRASCGPAQAQGDARAPGAAGKGEAATVRKERALAEASLRVCFSGRRSPVAHAGMEPAASVFSAPALTSGANRRPLHVCFLCFVLTRGQPSTCLAPNTRPTSGRCCPGAPWTPDMCPEGSTSWPLPSPPHLPPWCLEAGPPWQKAEGGPVCSKVGPRTLEIAQLLPCAEKRGPGAGVLFNQHPSRQGPPVSESVSFLQKKTTLLAWFPYDHLIDTCRDGLYSSTLITFCSQAGVVGSLGTRQVELKLA